MVRKDRSFDEEITTKHKPKQKEQQMSEYTLNNDLITSIRAHSGVSNLPVEAIEIVWKDAEKAAKDRGTAIEFIAAELCKALFAKAFSEARRNGKQTVDFQAYCREQLASKESIFSKLFAKKSKVASLVAEAEAIESEISETRSALGSSQQKAQELKNDLASTESELANYSEKAIDQSVLEAAKIWHLKGKSPHNSSIVENAISHIVEAEASIRILNARLVWLRDLIGKEETKIESFKQELKRLEKQLS